MTETGAPDYQRIADDIRDRVRSREYPVGAAIPSTPELEKRYGVSKTPVRQAVDLLRREGILAGRPGKGVYVLTTPAGADARRVSITELSAQVAELRAMAEHGGLDDVRAGLGRLEANLIDLYGKLGFSYPDSSSGDTRKKAASRGHTSRR